MLVAQARWGATTGSTEKVSEDESSTGNSRRVVGVTEAATIKKVSARTIRVWIKNGVLPARRLHEGNDRSPWMIRVSDLMKVAHPRYGLSKRKRSRP